MDKRIMIVDDDQSIRKTVEIILSANGYSVCTAERGKECRNKLREGFNGLILMDIMMPEMDGWDTIAAIEEEKLHGGKHHLHAHSNT